MNQKSVMHSQYPNPESVSGIRSDGPTATEDGACHGFPNTEDSPSEIRQFCNYGKNGAPVPDNNPFWENGNNPLSSKGN